MAGSLAELMVSIIGDVSDVRRAFDEVDKSTGALGQSMTSLGNDMSNMGKSMSLYVTAPLVAMGVGVGKMAMSFESEMLKVQAVTGATGEEIANMSDLAIELGANTVFSATDAADAFYYLGQAGYDVDQITKAVADTMNLAAAGEMELGSAANIVTNILAGYGLGADGAAHVTDVLAQSAADTKAEVEPMGVAFSYIGPLAKEMGWSIEETAAILGEFSLRGYEGERAGAGLVTAMTNLLSPTDKVNEILAKYGLTIDDVNPSTHSFVQIVDTLNSVGLSTSDTMAIFGDRAGPQMLAAMSQGTEGIVTQTEKLKECDGAAQRMAETMTSGSEGGIEEFKGALESLGLKIGQLINDYMDPIYTKLTEVARAFTALPEPVLLLVVAMAGLAAAIGPVLTVAGILISSIGTITTAIAGAGGLSAVLTTFVGILTGPVAIAIAAFAAAAYIVYKNWDTIGPMLDRLCDKIKTVFNSIMDFVDPAIDKITEFVDGALTSLSEWWEVNGEAITQAATTIGQKLMEVFETMGGVILFFVSGPMIMLYEAFRVALDIIIPLLEYLGRQFGETIMLIVNIINGDFSAACENLKNIFKNTIDFIIQLITEVLPTAFSDVWDDILKLASYALDLLIQLITGKTGEAATALKEGIVNAGAEMVDGMLGWVPGVSGAVDGIRDELLRVPDEANTAMSQFGPVVTGHIDAAAVQAAAHTGTLVTGVSSQTSQIVPQTTSAMAGFPGAVVSPINAAFAPARTAAASVGTGATTGLTTGMSGMPGVATSTMNGVAANIRSSGTDLASAATSAGAAAVSALNIQLAKVQYTSAQIKAAAASGQLFASSAGSSSSSSGSGGSGGGSSGGSSGPGWTGSKPTSTGAPYDQPSQTVKKEKHDTGGIAGYTGWHWMEQNELAVPEKFDWDGVLTSSLSKALKSVASSGVSNSYAGDTVINVNATLTPQYNFETLMRDIERELSKNKTRRGILS